jgi:predicted XRE-type DNA-binding protein
MSKSKIIQGSGNVFADIGLPNPEKCLEKANLVSEIISIIKKKRITQIEVAKILGVSQPRVSDLMSGHFYRFSLSKLVDFLDALGKRVSFTIHDKAEPDVQSNFSPNISSGKRVSARGA